jgi:hypothetical protein
MALFVEIVTAIKTTLLVPVRSSFGLQMAMVVETFQL